MNFQTIYKQYTPNFWGFLGFHAASICFPKLSPFLGIWYHCREIYDNNEYTESLGKQIELQLPHESETKVISVQAEINDAAFANNILGLVASVMELGALIYMPDVYTECSLRGKLKTADDDGLLIGTKILNFSSFIFGLRSYAFTNKEYDLVDASTGMRIDPYFLSHPKTKVVGLYKPQSESATDYTSTDETTSDELFQPEAVIQQEEI